MGGVDDLIASMAAQLGCFPLWRGSVLIVEHVTAGVIGA